MNKNKVLVRSHIERAEGENLRLSVSSETPCRNVIRTANGYVVADVVLLHTPEAINGNWIKEGIAMRDNHGGEVVARGMEVHLDEKKLVCDSIIWGASDKAQTIRADVESGVLRDLSIEADYEEDDVEEAEDGTYIIRKWTPLACAFVAIPADPSVGINREFTNKAEEVKVQEEPSLKANIERAKPMNNDKIEGDALANEEVVPVVQSMVDTSVEITRDEMAQYSILRAIRHLVAPNTEKADIERKVSDKLAKQMGREARGIWMPMNRDMTTASTSAGGLVGVQHRASDFISLLRNKTILDKLGVSFVGGLRGNVAFPKMTAGSTAYWVTEGTAVTESSPTCGQVLMTPKTVGATVDISRTLMKQSSPDADAVVQDDIYASIALAIQSAVFNGTGTSGQPLGILSNTAITATTFDTTGAPTFAEICEMTGGLDAYYVDGGKWVINNTNFAELRGTKRFASGGGDRTIADIVNGQKYLADEPCYTTAQLTAGNAIYGKWEEVLIGMWGGLDLNVDTNSLSTSGGIRLVGLQDVDIAIRHAQAFAKSAGF